jgi:peroxiredoxin
MGTELSQTLEDKFNQIRDMDASLADKLLAYAQEVQRMSPDYAAAVDTLVNRLMESRAGAAAPNVGERMPSFVLPDDTGNLIRLEDILKNGPAAIAFHRGYWCPYCRINIRALAKADDAVKALHCQIVAIVPERQKFTTWLKSDAQAKFPVLSDMDNGYAMSLGLAYWIGDQMISMMQAAGRDFTISQGADSWMLPIPATFVVNTDGLIVARFVDPDYRTRMAIDDMIAALTHA